MNKKEHVAMKMSFYAIAIGIGWVAFLTAFSGGNCAANTSESKPVVVHLSKFTNDLHAVSMALKLAAGMQEKGATVSLFVDLDGVRLTDKRQPLDLVWGHGKPVGELYDNFVKVGGKVLVCPHCAHAVGLLKESLRAGATIAEEGQLVDAIGIADRILDY